jgi:CBS domain-containing protein
MMNLMNQRIFVSTPGSKFPHKVIADCMSSSVHVLTPEMSVEEAMTILLSHGISGAPVVDKNLHVIGIVSSFDFLQKEAFQGALLPMEGSIQNVEHYIDIAQKICGQRVQDVMTTYPSNIITIESNALMRQAATIMTEHRINRLPVIDPMSRQLVGVITCTDIMIDLLHVLQKLPPAQCIAT